MRVSAFPIQWGFFPNPYKFSSTDSLYLGKRPMNYGNLAYNRDPGEKTFSPSGPKAASSFHFRLREPSLESRLYLVWLTPDSLGALGRTSTPASPGDRKTRLACIFQVLREGPDLPIPAGAATISRPRSCSFKKQSRDLRLVTGYSQAGARSLAYG
jgi:hypothetical protein